MGEIGPGKIGYPVWNYPKTGANLIAGIKIVGTIAERSTGVTIPWLNFQGKVKVSFRSESVVVF